MGVVLDASFKVFDKKYLDLTYTAYIIIINLYSDILTLKH